jgi:hypothetical protein
MFAYLPPVLGIGFAAFTWRKTKTALATGPTPFLLNQTNGIERELLLHDCSDATAEETTRTERDNQAKETKDN